MSISTTPFREHRSLHWDELHQVVLEWRQWHRARHELESLDDSLLRDIGLSRGESGFEASKPFWRN